MKDKDITIEDIRKWKQELDNTGIPKREYNVSMFTSKSELKKIAKLFDRLMKKEMKDNE